MKKLLTTGVLVLAVSIAHADGDAAAGKAKAVVCGACHSADGNSAIAMYPKLAGQNERYLLKQMKDIKSGDISKGGRSIPMMTGQLDNLSEQDMADIAAYFASQKITLGAAKKKLLALGEQVYRFGVVERGIPACTACHSPTGKGNTAAGFPALGGQHADYISSQLKEFRLAAENPDKGRHNDTELPAVMRQISFKLSDKEIEAVSSYISGLH